MTEALLLSLFCGTLLPVVQAEMQCSLDGIFIRHAETKSRCHKMKYLLREDDAWREKEEFPRRNVMGTPETRWAEKRRIS